MVSLLSLSKRGRMDRIHAVVRQRNWRFTTAEQFKAWLSGHAKLAKTHGVHAQLSNLSELPPEHFIATLESIGIKIPSSTEDLGEWTYSPKLLRQISKPNSPIKTTDEFRHWLKHSPTKVRDVDATASIKRMRGAKESLSQSTGSYYHPDYEMQYAAMTSREAATRAILAAAEESRDLKKLRRIAHLVPADNVHGMANGLGWELESSEPNAVHVTPTVAAMLRREFENLRNPADNIGKARKAIRAIRDLHAPRFSSDLEQLLKYSGARIHGSLGLPAFAQGKAKRKLPTLRLRRKKRGETRDSQFQEARSDARRVTESTRLDLEDAEKEIAATLKLRHPVQGAGLIHRKPGKYDERGSEDKLRREKARRRAAQGRQAAKDARLRQMRK